MPRIPQVIQLKSALSIAMLGACMALLPFPAASVQAGEGISMLQSVRIGLEHSPAVLTERQALRISLSTLEDARAGTILQLRSPPPTAKTQGLLPMVVTCIPFPPGSR